MDKVGNATGEALVRVSLTLLYLGCRFARPNILSVSDVSEWAHYSHPYCANPHIPSSVLLALVLSIAGAAGMFGLLVLKYALRDGVTWTSLAHEGIHYFWASSLAFLVAACCTNLCKVFVGRMRPDFLNRCFPTAFQADRVPPIDLLTLVHPTPQCEPNSPYDIKDGRKSFPSGHSSYFASVCLLAALFIHHIFVASRLYTMKKKRTLSPLVFCRGAELTLVVGLGFLVPVWAGSTRVVDRRHHPSDVVAGLLIGWVIGVVVYRLYYVMEDKGTSATEGMARTPSQELMYGGREAVEVLPTRSSRGSRVAYH